MVEDRRWGSGTVDLRSWSLPRIKAERALAALADLSPGASVLDFGCGEGKMLSTVRAWRQDLMLYGVDIQAPLEPGPCFEFGLVSADGELPFERTFDAVLCLDVLEHVSQPEKILAALHACLAPSGRLVAFVPFEGQPLSPFGFYRWILGADLYLHTKSHVQAYCKRSFFPLFDRYFDVQHRSYSYHVLGTLLDATFFALTRLRGLGHWFWRRNSIYHPENRGRGVLNHLLEAANAVCYLESLLLERCPYLAMGMHLTARPRPDLSMKEREPSANNPPR